MELIERNYGELTTLETRHDSYELALKNANKRYGQIITILDNGYKMTIREMIYEMMKQGFISEPDRNRVAPRVHELVTKGILEPCGKKKDRLSNRTVTAYRLRKEMRT